MKIKVWAMMGVMLFTVLPCQATIYEWTSGDYEISDGDDYGSDHIKLLNLVTVDMSGGVVGTLSAYDSSIFSMSGGNLYNTSHANILDSDIAIAMFSNDSSTADISGGIIGRLSASGDSIVNIYGSGFQYSPLGGHWGAGYLTGFWENGDSFTIDFDGDSSYDHINLHVIPEPATLLLFGLGAGLLRKRTSKS